MDQSNSQNNQFPANLQIELEHDYYLENSRETLKMGKLLALLGIPFIGLLTVTEMLQIHCPVHLIMRLVGLLPMFLFLILAKIRFSKGQKGVILYHSIMLSGLMIMMAGITFFRFVSDKYGEYPDFSSGAGGLMLLLLVGFLFAAGARKYLIYIFACPLFVLLVGMLFVPSIPMIELAPFLSVLLASLAILITVIAQDKLLFQEFKMRKLAQARQKELELEIRAKNQLNETLQVEIKERKKLESRLSKQATIDELTGVFNRRFAFIILKKAISSAKRSMNPLIVCFIDLDNLKTVNDRYGHSEGNRMLTHFAKVLKRYLREADYTCRIGGDEFLIIFQESSLQEAGVIVERLRKELNKKKIKKVPIDFSYGFSQYDKKKTSTPDSLVDMADKDMYRMKVFKKSKFF